MLIDLLKWITAGLAVVLFQIGFGNAFLVFGVRPDWVLIYCIIVGLSRDANSGLVAGFLTGLIQDAVSAGFLGVYALGRSSAVFWMVRFTASREGLVRGSGFGWPVLIAATAIFQGVIAGFFIHQGAINISVGSLMVHSILPSAIYTAIVGWLWVQLPWGRVPIGSQGISFRSRSKFKTEE